MLKRPCPCLRGATAAKVGANANVNAVCKLAMTASGADWVDRNSKKIDFSPVELYRPIWDSRRGVLEH